MLGGVARLARVQHLDRDVVVVKEPTQDVYLVDERLGDGHVGRVAVGHRGVPVGAVHHQRVPDLAPGHDLAQRPVARVIAAHETDLDETLAVLHLGLDDAQAARGRGGQRLLAEHGLPGGDGGQHELLVRRPPRGDHHYVHVGGGDHVAAGRKGPGPDPRRNVLGPRAVDVGHRHHARPADPLVDPARMLDADRARPDDADLVCHGFAPRAASISR